MSFMSESCLHFLFIQFLYSFSNSLIFLNLLYSLFSFLLLEAICCCSQTCNVVASEVMVANTCVPSLIVIDTTIKQLKNNVSLLTIYCLRLFVM